MKKLILISAVLFSFNGWAEKVCHIWLMSEDPDRETSMVKIEKSIKDNCEVDDILLVDLGGIKGGWGKPSTQVSAYYCDFSKPVILQTGTVNCILKTITPRESR